jgi:ferredoxin
MCIYEAEEMYYTNPDECIECGACEPERPVNAIFHESAVPEEWQSFSQKNRELSGL